MESARSCPSPMLANKPLSLQHGDILVNSELYRSIVGALWYLTLTIPDISFAVNKLSQFVRALTSIHWKACKRLLRYLNGTICHGLKMQASIKFCIHAFTDLEWASDRDDKRSISGVCTVNAVENGSMESKPQVVGVGVILNLASPVGLMAEGYISMAVSDIYAIHANYRTRLALSVKDSVGDVVEAESAALELINDEQVQAIIGPQASTEAKFLIDLGDRAQIAIISFSATSPSLSPTQNPFFIRTAQDDFSQVKALTSIVETYGWKKVVLIYEDIEYGNGLIPYLTDALQVINIRVPHRSIISPNSSQFEILKQLNMIMARETRILLVHVSASLGSKLFRLAKQIGMMSEGYAWIITKGLSSLLDPLRKKVFGSMHGVVGVRPYLPNSKRLQDFKTRWNKTSGDINLFGLWAYDTVWALAMAAESLNPTALLSHNSSINSIEPFGLRVSESGPQLLQKLLNIKFEGLSGEFNLIRGQLKPTDYK
ncbi:glutamate receptor 2.8-like [Ziziphus jujuba]|uniref:Glutamate receptor 2.8-like n=1 Tax=Ziziphus jujuba TaxID=326968 RepID=A0ABM4A8J2_ZIZJJ|nr:glutamate receptor 2.8-like [Ziziphus jujuba]